MLTEVTERECRGLNPCSSFGPSVSGFSSFSASRFIRSLILLRVCLKSPSSERLILGGDSILMVGVTLP